MRTSKKRFSLFASFVIAASVLAACSSSETPAPSTSGDLGLSNDPFLAAEETSGTPTDTSLNADSSTGATDATDSAAATSSPMQALPLRWTDRAALILWCPLLPVEKLQLLRHLVYRSQRHPARLLLRMQWPLLLLTVPPELICLRPVAHRQQHLQ